MPLLGYSTVFTDHGFDPVTPLELQICDSIRVPLCRRSRRDEELTATVDCPPKVQGGCAKQTTLAALNSQRPLTATYLTPLEKKTWADKVRPALFVVLCNRTGPLTVQ